jgi:hypothetical protein
MLEYQTPLAVTVTAYFFANYICQNNIINVVSERLKNMLN